MTSRWMLVLYGSYAIVKISLFSMQYVWCMRATMLLATLRVCTSRRLQSFCIKHFPILLLSSFCSCSCSPSLFLFLNVVLSFLMSHCFICLPNSPVTRWISNIFDTRTIAYFRKNEQRKEKGREKEKGAIISKREEQISLINSRDIVKFITNVIQWFFFQSHQSHKHYQFICLILFLFSLALKDK